MTSFIIGPAPKSKTVGSQNITITGAVSSAGLIKLTATAHGLETGDVVQISGVTGTVEANGQWVIAVVDANHFTLNNSTFGNAYSSGGTAAHVGFASVGLDVSNVLFPVRAYERCCCYKIAFRARECDVPSHYRGLGGLGISDGNARARDGVRRGIGSSE